MMIAISSDPVLVTLLMILLASVPQNTLYLAACDQILAILSKVVDEFLCPWLYSKPEKYTKLFSRLIWTPPPPCQKPWVRQ